MYASAKNWKRPSGAWAQCGKLQHPAPLIEDVATWLTSGEGRKDWTLETGHPADRSQDVPAEILSAELSAAVEPA